jgi:hypothetical protein
VPPAAAAVLLLVGGCSAMASDDRQSGNGTKPDRYDDLSNVVIYRAPDEVPNLVLACAGPYAFALTLNGTAGRGQLQRQPDLDGVWCGWKPG